jgi:AAA domain
MSFDRASLEAEIKRLKCEKKAVFDKAGGGLVSKEWVLSRHERLDTQIAEAHRKLAAHAMEPLVAATARPTSRLATDEIHAIESEPITGIRMRDMRDDNNAEKAELPSQVQFIPAQTNGPTRPRQTPGESVQADPPMLSGGANGRPLQSSVSGLALDPEAEDTPASLEQAEPNGPDWSKLPFDDPDSEADAAESKPPNEPPPNGADKPRPNSGTTPVDPWAVLEPVAKPFMDPPPFAGRDKSAGRSNDRRQGRPPPESGADDVLPEPPLPLLWGN